MRSAHTLVTGLALFAVAAGLASATVAAAVSGNQSAAPGTPGIPSIVKVAPGSITISWTAPKTRPEAVTGYQVRGTGGYSKSCSSTTCRLTGLVNGRAYGFQVAAKSAAGVGPFSRLSETRTPRDLPSAPGAPKAGLHGMAPTVSLSWAAATASASPVLGYEVRALPGGLRGTASTNRYTFLGLTPGESYTFRVRARTSSGAGAWGPESALVTLRDHLPAPSGIEVFGDGSQHGPNPNYIRLRVPALPYGQELVDHYEVRINGGDWSTLRNTSRGTTDAPNVLWRLQVTPPGPHVVDVRAVDLDGVAGAIASDSTTVAIASAK